MVKKVLSLSIIKQDVFWMYATDASDSARWR